MAQILSARKGEYLQTAFKLLHHHDGQLAFRELAQELSSRLTFSKYELDRFKKTRNVRWVAILHFFSIGCVKAGWLRKDKGVWYLTDEGGAALKLDPETFMKTSGEKYQEWKSRQTGSVEPEEQTEQVDQLKTSTAVYQDAEVDAFEEITQYMKALNPYEFQDLVAALFRGMGYYTPFTAPKGKDGGIDVIVYKDPIGADEPRIRVQVKHRPDTKVSPAEVGYLFSNISKRGCTGVIVSTGGVSADSLVKIREANQHIEPIDIKTFIALWKKHYDCLSSEDKNLMPPKRIAFLAPIE